ncbi:MAG TPA: bifunctional precorrin-2 dehydrogenase/sirohydrochlorin ferrochelatase [Candidatus Omnitrophota bacterium]|nr:bifunctional precorrin-2 dehydrogenase/sirohydrochlorin ferrochelatase [Candidatus Omnitrophota bacterium]
MQYYPVLLDIRKKTCCVIGGGQIAERKARSLLTAGAAVTVISPAVTAGIAALAAQRRLRWKRCGYRRAALKGCVLAIAATDRQEVNRAVSQDAGRLGILANIVDVPSLSSFIVPAVAHRDGLIIAVSTSGKAPALSRRIKSDIEKQYIGRYARVMKTVETARRQLKKNVTSFRQRKKKLVSLVNSLL